MTRCTRVVSHFLLPLSAWLLVLGACSDELPTAPRAAPSQSQSSLLLTADDPPAPPGTFSTTLSPTASNQDAGPVTFGTIATSTLVEVKASGLLDQYYGESPGWPEELRGEFKQQWDAGGTFNYLVYCKGYVSVWSTEGDSKQFCRYDASTPLTEVWIDTLVMEGELGTQWSKGPYTGSRYCDGTGEPACYTYTGSFAITVTPVAGSLELTAVPSTVHSGDTVVFAASAGGASFTVQEWIWQPDEPPITFSSSTGGAGSYGAQMTTSGSSCGAGDATCVRAITETGTMYVRATINGHIEQASARVVVMPDCETGDPILDDPDVQAGLKSLWESGTPDDPDPWSRLEKGGWLVDDGNGQYHLEPFTSPPWASFPCKTDPIGGFAIPPNTVAWVHTHPFETGELMTTCEPYMVKLAGGVEVPAYQRYGNLPSEDDGNASYTLQKPGYLLDKNKLMKYTGNPNSPLKLDVLDQYPRCGY